MYGKSPKPGIRNCLSVHGNREETGENQGLSLAHLDSGVDSASVHTGNCCTGDHGSNVLVDRARLRSYSQADRVFAEHMRGEVELDAELFELQSDARDSGARRLRDGDGEFTTRQKTRLLPAECDQVWFCEDRNHRVLAKSG
jgi:hypothetical protein